MTPLAGYQQETRFAFGIASAYIFKTDKTDTLLRTSTIPTGILYTLNEQIILGVGGNIFLPKERYNIKFENTFSKFPDKFWGVGNFTSEPYESYTFTQFFINPQLHRKVWKNFFIGSGWEFQRVYNIRYVDDGYFERDNVLGVSGRSAYQISGLSLYFTYDSRDHAYVPDKGMLLKLRINNSYTFFGSDYNFQAIEIDYRKFIRIARHHVFAFQALGIMTFGDVPYRSLPVLGGNSIMRGYYSGRFRDKIFYGLQAEYRFDIFWRFGGVLFVSTGRVLDKLENFSLKDFKLSGGPGLRICLLPKEKLNLRIDLGITETLSIQPYITITEAF